MTAPTQDQLSQLHAQWIALLTALDADLSASERVWQDLLQRYSEDHRHYHNLSHIAAMLKHAQNCKCKLESLPVVQLAIWFHDAIYDARAKDNEFQSAALTQFSLNQLKISPSVTRQVMLCILATARHELPNEIDVCHDLPAFLDMDLAILGTAPETYKKYSAAIRAEYAYVLAPLYRIGRVKMLKTFLQRDRLFFTDDFYQRYEQLARANIKDEIRQLEFF